MKIKEAFIFVDRSVDSAKHRATIETSKFELLIQGVNNVEEGVSVAKQLVEQGVSAVDLCPGFGYTGVKAVSDAVGDKVPVGMVTHQLQDAPKLAKALEAWEQSEPHAGHGCMGDPVERQFRDVKILSLVPPTADFMRADAIKMLLGIPRVDLLELGGHTIRVATEASEA